MLYQFNHIVKNGIIDTINIIFDILINTIGNNQHIPTIYIHTYIELALTVSLKNQFTIVIIELDSLPQCKTLYINAARVYIITLAQINKHIIKNNSEVLLISINNGPTIQHIHAKI
ncbi:MAG: hypothetical protein M0R51_13260 [Clostridia bacterium]|jgi:hypothetical protein|nr:hypothetical protein [Clostridia bacterium]